MVACPSESVPVTDIVPLPKSITASCLLRKSDPRITSTQPAAITQKSALKVTCAPFSSLISKSRRTLLDGVALWPSAIMKTGFSLSRTEIPLYLHFFRKSLVTTLDLAPVSARLRVFTVGLSVSAPMNVVSTIGQSCRSLSQGSL